MKTLIRYTLTALCLFAAITVCAQTPSDNTDAACKKILATAPQPPANQAGTYKPNCDSTIYYFGIDHGVDYAAARQCAYAERANAANSTDSSPFAGAGVLSMIYANGQGTPRNVPLARRFVCENSMAAPAELQARLDLLDKIAAATSKAPHFDLCETSTSGLSGGWCQSIDSRKADTGRDAKIAAIKATLSPPALAAFALLQKVEAHFEDLSSSNEVDLSGTLRGAFAQQHQDALKDQFLADLQMLDKPARAATNADVALNAVYAKLKAKLPADQAAANANPGDFGTINFVGVRDTERIWLDLRNVWTNYARLAAPHYPAASLTSTLTKQRTRQLQDILTPPTQ